MIILYGFVDRDRLVKSGSFACPNCRRSRYCERHRIESWYSLFFLTLIRWEVVAEYVKCETCRHSFEVPSLRPFLPRGGYLPSDLRAELLAGAPIEAVVERLIGSGVDPESARNAVHEIAGGGRQICPPCGLTFLGEASVCQACGGALTKCKHASGFDPGTLV